MKNKTGWIKDANRTQQTRSGEGAILVQECHVVRGKREKARELPGSQLDEKGGKGK